MLWLVLVLLALPIGFLVLRPIFNRNVNEELTGIKMEHLMPSMVTAGILLVAFVLAQTALGFRAVTERSGAESGIVDNMFEVAGMLPDGQGRRIQELTVCYARAVARTEFPELARSGSPAPEVSVWSGQFSEEVTATFEGPSVVVNNLVRYDFDRSEARRIRLTEAAPNTPIALFVVMVMGVTGLIMAMSVLIAPTVPTGKLGFALVMITWIAVTLGAMVYLISEFERPFAGIVRVEPVHIERVADSLAEDYAQLYPDDSLPCDENGVEI